MYVQNLELADFRNYSSACVSFSPHVNVVFGQNAQGKTNLIEALYLLCLGRSFRLARNQDLLNTKAASFTLSANVIKDKEIRNAVFIKYIRDGKKEININRKRLQSHSKIFGQFPVVVMAPDEFRITTSGPSERRRFLNILLSQVSLSYLSDLQEYNRILKQRNRILQNICAGNSIEDSVIAPWTENLIRRGKRIMLFRESFVAQFSVSLAATYRNLTNQQDDLQIEIKKSVSFTTDEEIEHVFLETLERQKRKERALGNTLAGPHRDDIIFKINDMELRKYGSRGEHKSVLLALKIAEFKYLRKALQETPLLLLDDCYSELDAAREENVLKSIDGLGQVVLTTPKQNLFSDHSHLFANDTARFCVEGGQIGAVTQ